MAKDTAVRVLSVVPPPYIGVGFDGMAASAALGQIATQADDLAKQAALDGTELLRRAGLAVDTKIRLGDPRHEIVAEAAEWSSDLIVIGSHGHTGVGRWLLGSVAESVVRHAPCSVEVVREKASARK